MGRLPPCDSSHAAKDSPGQRLYGAATARLLSSLQVRTGAINSDKAHVCALLHCKL